MKNLIIGLMLLSLSSCGVMVAEWRGEIRKAQLKAEGEAQLLEAYSSKKIAIESARAQLESAKLLSQAEIERARYVYNRLPLMYDVVMVQAIKKRDPSTGRIISYELEEGVKGRDCVVIDDICDGGATFELLGEYLKKGGSLSNNLIVAHGIFSKGKERLNELYDTILVFYDWTT